MQDFRAGVDNLLLHGQLLVVQKHGTLSDSWCVCVNNKAKHQHMPDSLVLLFIYLVFWRSVGACSLLASLACMADSAISDQVVELVA